MSRVKRNEFVPGVGGGPPRGELFRRYWLPVLLGGGLPGPIAAEELPYGRSPADAGEQFVAFDWEHRLLRRRGRGDRAATVEGVLEDPGPAVVVGEHGVELDELEAEPSEIRLVWAGGEGGG